MASAMNQGQNVKDKVKDTAASAADKAKDMASNVADKARDTASNVADKARDAASNVADRAGDLAHKAMDRAGDFASNMGERADNAAASVGSGMKTAASTVRENLPREGMLGSASSSVAGTLESAGDYLEAKGLSGVAEDLTGLIKRNPIPAVLIGIGIGYLLACSTRR